MNPSAPPLADPKATPSCANHPERSAVGTCARCGAFFCEAEALRHGEHTYCEACGRRPEVSYLEEMRRRLWGKRNAWAWLMLLAAPVHLTFGITLGLDGQWDWAVMGTVTSGVLVAWFLGVSLARPGLVLLPLAWLAVFLAKDRIGWMLAPPLTVWLVLALALYFDTRTQLFFKREVDAEKLARLWDERENNPQANRAQMLGMLSLVLPLLAPVAVVLGIIGLWRVDPAARPPIGKRGQALAGIVLGVLALLFWREFIFSGTLPFSRLGR